MSGSAGAVETDLVASKPVGPIQEQQVEVGIEVQGRAETLDQGDGSCLRTRGHCESRPSDQQR